MERVAFILEQSNERIGCMLNPESFEVRRYAGIHQSQSLGVGMPPAAQADDPILWTGGGRTEISLDLLFDLSLQSGSEKVEDIREFTRPLHALSEKPSEGELGAPIVRFIWGKAWNIRCLVAGIAERFEQFAASGCPQRSWLSMRLVRVSASKRNIRTSPPTVPVRLKPAGNMNSLGEVDIKGNGGSLTSDRLDVLAEEKYGNPGFWRLIAAFNDLDDPLHIAPGISLQLPPKSIIEEPI